MQIKFLTVGLLLAAVSMASAGVIKVEDTNVSAKNTASCIANNLKIKDVLNDARVNVANKKRSALSGEQVARIARRAEQEPEADEEEEDEEEEDEDEEEQM
ncbi:Cu-binding protein [Mucor velutinosus]|uniref:Cu-binding protein n=1 Tax=Mucor velutinosus TaxID=708070 RepID=A0AAN7DFK0_9FUNG|nr:Cu-binding protein [Mucor velutinosus]